MQLSEFLRPERVVTGIAQTDAKAILERLVGTLVEDGAVGTSDVVIEALLAREGVLSTGIGNGVAVPHVVSPEARESTIVIGIAPQGVEYGAIDGRPVYVFFVLLSPPDGEARTAHLKLLARIAQLARAPVFVQQLRFCAGGAEVIEFIRSYERTHP